MHLNFHTGTSERSFGDFVVENSSIIFFLICFVTQDVCIDHYEVEQMKKKVSSTIYCLPSKWIIWQHLVWSVHTSFILAVVQHSSWFYFMCPPLTMVPQQVHLHGQWFGKRNYGCPPIWWSRGGMLFLLVSRKCLFRHFFSVGHHCAHTHCFASP